MRRLQYRVARAEPMLAGLLIAGFGGALLTASFAGPAAGLAIMVGVALLLAALCLHVAIDRASAAEEARTWEQHIRRQLHEDAETGLGTRRQFDVTWIRDVARARRWGEPFSLVVLDVQDAFGAPDPMTPEAARAVGRILSEAARGEDAVFRLGNATFAALLSSARADGASAFLERVRVRISSDPIPSGSGSFFTVYGGVSEWHEDHDSPDTMLRNAENDMRRYGVELRRQSDAWGTLAS